MAAAEASVASGAVGAAANGQSSAAQPGQGKGDRAQPQASRPNREGSDGGRAGRPESTDTDDDSDEDAPPSVQSGNTANLRDRLAAAAKARGDHAKPLLNTGTTNELIDDPEAEGDPSLDNTGQRMHLLQPRQAPAGLTEKQRAAWDREEKVRSSPP